MDMGKIFNPEKYGMVFCPDCKGKGKLPKNLEGFNVCSRCGGSGVFEKEKKTPKRIENKRNITESSKLY
jgi:DnaJ-class molecular chaperone